MEGLKVTVAAKRAKLKDTDGPMRKRVGSDVTADVFKCSGTTC